MGDINITLTTYGSDIAKRVLNLTSEIPDEEREDLKNFISETLVNQGNPGVFETLAWGVREQFKLWIKIGKDKEKFELEVSKIYREAVDKRGHVW